MGRALTCGSNTCKLRIDTKFRICCFQQTPFNVIRIPKRGVLAAINFTLGNEESRGHVDHAGTLRGFFAIADRLGENLECDRALKT